MTRFRIRSRGLSWAAIAVAGAITVAPADAATVQAYAQAVGGQSSTTLFTSPLPTLGDFGFGSAGVFNPAAGNAASGVAADSPPLATAASGTVTNSAALASSFLGRTFSGSAASRARSGDLGAAASATFAGDRDGLTVIGAQGAAVFNETFALNSPAIAIGTPGLMHFDFTLDGALTVNGSGPQSSTAALMAFYRHANDAADVTRILLNVQVSREDAMPNFFANPTTGFIVNPGSAVGANTYSTLDMPFVWGVPFDFTFGLLAFVIPGSGHQGSVDFMSSAVVTGITATAEGLPIDDFTVTTASGAAYSRAGLVPVPLPGAALLLDSALAASGGRYRTSR